MAAANQGGGRSGGGGNPGGGNRGGSTAERSPNDDRSDVKNPNNSAHDADRANREQQTRGG